MTEESSSEKNGIKDEVPNNIKPLSKGISQELNHTVQVLDEEEAFPKGRIRLFYSPASFYFISFLSFIYLLLSLSNDEYSINPSSTWTLMETISDYSKFGLAIFFLIEVLMRILFYSSSRHFFSYWIILDLIVVVACVYIESRFLFQDVNNITDCDEYFIPFRLWYTFRTVRQITNIQELKEDEIYEIQSNELDKINQKRDRLRTENKYMEIDLEDIRELIRDIATRKVDYDQKSLISNRSSWQSLVPMNFCFGQSPTLKRAASVISESKKSKASFLERRSRRMTIEGPSRRNLVFESPSINQNSFDL